METNKKHLLLLYQSSLQRNIYKAIHVMLLDIIVFYHGKLAEF